MTRERGFNLAIDVSFGLLLSYFYFRYRYSHIYLLLYQVTPRTKSLDKTDAEKKLKSKQHKKEKRSTISRTLASIAERKMARLRWMRRRWRVYFVQHSQEHRKRTTRKEKHRNLVCNNIAQVGKYQVAWKTIAPSNLRQRRISGAEKSKSRHQLSAVPLSIVFTTPILCE